jgi:DNA topoisomerase-2
MGLTIGKQYEDLKSLRYGAIMIMSDQDTDGSHIKGLVINFIQHFWPSLFKINGFVKQFITPLLKVSKKGKPPIISFYTMNDFKVWA